MNKNQKYLIQTCFKGIIATAYSKTYMLSVNEEFEIDRVRWSIVKLKTDGKEFRDFFMETKDMNWLCEEIISGRAEKVITEDNGKNPNAYSFKSGEGGNQVFVIGGGTVGCRVMMRNKQEDWTMAINLRDLRDIAFMYRLASGLVLTQEDTYYNRLQLAFHDGIYHRQQEKEGRDDEYAEAEAMLLAEGDKAPEQVPATKIVSRDGTRVFHVVLNGRSTKIKEFISIDGVDEDTKESVRVLFRMEEMVCNDTILRAVSEAVKEEIRMAFVGEKRENYILYGKDAVDNKAASKSENN